MIGMIIDEHFDILMLGEGFAGLLDMLIGNVLILPGKVKLYRDAESIGLVEMIANAAGVIAYRCVDATTQRTTVGKDTAHAIAQ